MAKITTKEKIIKVLKRYFDDKDDVILAFLFGSVAKAHYGALSDIDIAVYLKEGANEIKIWCDIERLLGKEIDLLVLNRAIPAVAWNAIRGIPLAIKDRALYLGLVLEVSREAIDLMERNLDMWKLKEEIRCQV